MTGLALHSSQGALRRSLLIAQGDARPYRYNADPVRVYEVLDRVLEFRVVQWMVHLDRKCLHIKSRW